MLTENTILSTTPDNGLDDLIKTLNTASMLRMQIGTDLSIEEGKVQGSPLVSTFVTEPYAQILEDHKTNNRSLVIKSTNQAAIEIDLGNVSLDIESYDRDRDHVTFTTAKLTYANGNSILLTSR